MLLLVHILLAVASVVVVSCAFVVPAAATLRAAYVLTAGALASGGWLVMATHASLVSGCVAGLGYLAVIAGLSVAARYRLTAVRARR